MTNNSEALFYNNVDAMKRNVSETLASLGVESFSIGDVLLSIETAIESREQSEELCHGH